MVLSFRGIVIEVMSPEAGPMSAVEVGYFDNDPKKRGSMAWTARSVTLDLADATGRAHAAWWLAGQRGEQNPVEAAWRFVPEQAAQEMSSIDGSHFGMIEYEPALWMCGASGWTADEGPLSDLDASDDRRLPDGSRWVDAEALRRVVLHVAGLAP